MAVQPINYWDNGQVARDKINAIIQNANDNIPSIGANGNWYLWDTDTCIKATGPKWDTGEQWPQGIQGIQWPVGLQGPKWDTGPQGIQWDRGLKGDKWDTGATGVRGPQWDKGDTGPAGAKGEKGNTGEPWPRGEQWEQGPRGMQWEKGDKWDTGATGATGPKGDTGDTWPQGPKGDKWDTGDTWPAGEQWPQGPQGIQGVQGPEWPVRVYIITEDDVDINYNATKGVAPYSTSYGYTEYTIHEDAGIERHEGCLYQFILSTKVGTTTYRNVRVRIGENGERHGGGTVASVSACYAQFTKAYPQLFVYSTKYYADGALHAAYYDSNTTYAYLVNTYATGFMTISNGWYGARYSLARPTTPIGSDKPTYSSLVLSCATGTTKNVNSTLTYYADRHPQYIASANIASNTASANVTYQNYTTHDIRYTYNTSTTYVTPFRHLFIWLKDFDPSNYSFKADATIGNLFSEDKASVRFPESTAGDVYLYYVGYNTATWYTCNPDFDPIARIRKYTPSTKTFTPYK